MAGATYDAFDDADIGYVRPDRKTFSRERFQ
jgi:hypothetical protein